MKHKALLLGLTLVTVSFSTAIIPTSYGSFYPFTVVNAYASNKFSKRDFAVAAFLKWTKQDLDQLQNSSIAVEKVGNTFTIKSPNKQAIMAKVGNKYVRIKSEDQNGNTTHHKYLKKKLLKQYKKRQRQLKSTYKQVQQSNSNGNNSKATAHAPQQKKNNSKNDDPYWPAEQAASEENAWYSRMYSGIDWQQYNSPAYDHPDTQISNANSSNGATSSPNP